MRRMVNATGVTLVESMVALALIAVVAMFAMPPFVAWRQRDQVDARAATMLAALAAARVESVARGVRVSLCRGDGEPACAVAGHSCRRGGSGWSCGWAVVVLDASPRGTVLRRIPADPDVRVDGAATDVVFTPPAGQVIGGFRRFEFSPRALSTEVSAAHASRCLRIAAGGRARLAVGRCGAPS